MSFQKEIKRLAGTTGKEAQHAANILAGTTGKELLFCLNKIAGTSGKEFNGVVNLITVQNSGGEVSIFEESDDNAPDANAAISILATGSIIVGGFDALIRSFSNGFGGTWAFYDAGGLSY